MANVLEKIRAFDGHLTEIATLKARISELESVSAKATELEAALNEGATKLAEIEPLNAEIAGLRSQISAELQISTDLKAKLATATAEAEAAAAVRVGTQIGATMGVPVSAAPGAGATDDKPNFSALRGLEKVVAIEKWETEQRKNSQSKN